MHDLATLKEANPLLAFLRADGLVFRPLGAGVFTALCPFHVEKSPSFRVWEKDHHYHCYGCTAHGDLIDYLAHTRNLSKKDAITLLAEMTPHIHDLNRRAPAPAAPVESAPVKPLSDSRYAAWLAHCHALAADPAACTRLADWRGYSPDTVRGAALAGLLTDRWHYWSQPREALLVSAPTHVIEPAAPAESLVWTPIAAHIRLAPQTPGNPHPKPSWRYDPSGTKAWPFVWGSLQDAKYLFVTEGQWDALALADLCAWHTPDSLPPRTAIIGLRGATSWRLWLDPASALPLDPEAVVIAVSDADAAGAQWYAPGGFIDTLRPRVAKIITYRPTAPGCKDFNDLTKAGHLTGAGFLAWQRRRLILSRPQPRPDLTFIQWCRAAALREDDTGAAARFVLTDPGKLKGRKSPRHWRAYWRGLHLDWADLQNLFRIVQCWHDRLPPDTGQTAEPAPEPPDPPPEHPDHDHDAAEPTPTCLTPAPDPSLKPVLPRHGSPAAAIVPSLPASASKCPAPSATLPIPPQTSPPPS